MVWAPSAGTALIFTLSATEKPHVLRYIYTRGYWGELNHFARAILGQVTPGPTLEDGVKAIQLIDAILASIDSGEQVRLNNKE
jgi:predicted dehydrogenase